MSTLRKQIVLWKVVLVLDSLLRKTGEAHHNALKLLSGSAGANLILFISAPLIARIYLPEDVGVFQQIISLSAILATVCTLSYHYAIQLPEEESSAKEVAVLGMALTLSFTMLLGFIFAFIPLAPWQHLKLPPSKLKVSLLIVAVVIASGFQLVLEQAALRKKEFSLLALTRVARVGIAQGGALLLGLIFRNYLGLVLPYIFGIIVGLSVIYYRVFRSFAPGSVSVQGLCQSLKKYWKMPAFDTPSMFVNSVSNELAVLMFGAFFSSQKVGFYAIALRLGKAPLSMIGTAVSEVFFQKTASQYHSNSETIPLIVFNTIKKLLPISLLVTGGLYIVSPPLVYYYLGLAWTEVGTVIRILLVWFFFESIYNPVSTTFLVMNRQEILFTLNLCLLIARAVAIYYFRSDFVNALVALSIVSGAMYIIYILCAYHIARKGSKGHVQFGR